MVATVVVVKVSDHDRDTLSFLGSCAKIGECLWKNATTDLRLIIDGARSWSYSLLRATGGNSERPFEMFHFCQDFHTSHFFYGIV